MNTKTLDFLTCELAKCLAFFGLLPCYYVFVLGIGVMIYGPKTHGGEIQFDTPPPSPIVMERPPHHDPYADAFAASKRDRKPLVVLVGVNVREFKRAHTIDLYVFPGVVGTGIVIGTWHGAGMIRHDLPATATDAEIAAVIYPKPATATNEQAIKNYRAQSRNYGTCECLTTGEPCRCKPASDCGRQPCAIHSPLLNPNLVAPVPQKQQYFTLPAAENCPPGKP